jgi:hypothetical protein
MQRHVTCPPLKVEGATVRDVLEHYFRTIPQARGYVLDDQGGLRTHMAIFVDGQPLGDRRRLTDPVSANGTIDVMQALSGG